MRKFRIFEHISLDGVIEHGGGPNEDGDFLTVNGRRRIAVRPGPKP